MELSTSGFFAAFLAIVRMFFPELDDPSLKTYDVPQNELMPNYDFIVVGAGAAGSVVASRLTENPAWSVLLIEAGGAEDALSDTPLLTWSLYNTDRDWNFTTVPQKRACLSTDGRCRIPQGHVMGGSTVNGQLFYVRGNRRDYDRWAELGNTGWDYNNILKYFIKLERNVIPSLAQSPYRGTEGPYQVQYPNYRSPLWNVYPKAGEEIGLKIRDFNGKEQTGINNIQFGLLGPIKGSTARAYLNPIRNRRNLNVIKRSRVIRVLIDENRKSAIGVEYVRNGQKYVVRANKEVILSAGGINSPKLLMLSGIGPREELQRHNIKTIQDLPVGKNLQDHTIVPIYFLLNEKVTITTDVWKTNQSIIEFAKNRRGPLTAFGGEAMAFLNSLDRSGIPNFEMMFYSFYPLYNETQRRQLISIDSSVMELSSVGSVTLRSKNPFDPPLIDPRYYSAQRDWDIMVKGMQIAFEYINTPTMLKYSPKLFSEFHPLCQNRNRIDYIKCVIANYGESSYHPVGTARMGPDGDNRAVVTPELKVRGVNNLRVIDASIMPIITRANTMAPTIAIGEKGSDLVKNSYSH